MIKLRLRRMGKKRQPHYRIVAAEASWPRDGRFLEVIGYYNPRTDPYTLEVNTERARWWLEHGAQPTDTVRALLVRAGVLPPRESTKGATPATSHPAGETVSTEPQGRGA